MWRSVCSHWPSYMAAAFRAWARHPDALWMFIHVEALGRKLG